MEELGGGVVASGVDLAGGPEETVVDLVADLDVVDGDALRFERGDEIHGISRRQQTRWLGFNDEKDGDVRVDLRVQSVEVVWPARRRSLVSRISPYSIRIGMS